jgi:hypothetical protein
MTEKIEAIQASPPAYGGTSPPGYGKNIGSGEKTLAVGGTEMMTSQPNPLEAVKIDPVEVSCPRCSKLVRTITENVAGRAVEY